MEKDIIEVMDQLEIDGGIRNLVEQLWVHSYRTFDSCEGHDFEAYVLCNEGDSWFESDAHKYGLKKIKNMGCCIREFQDEVLKHGLDPNDFVDRRKSCKCGAGINGYSVYRGKLIPNQKS